MDRNFTNVEFISDLMNFSRFGALIQVFVITALWQYADQIVNDDWEELDIPVFLNNPEIWVELAKEVKERLETMYDPALLPQTPATEPSASEPPSA